jgi:predicted RNA-binding protein (virulence factor B family)
LIQIADYNELQILTIKIDGCFLDGGSDTIFLPAAEVPDGVSQGEYINVYLYRGQDGLIHGTTQIAPAVINGYGCFTVRKKQEYGAFLDWGLGRDLFLPKRFYRTEFKDGDKVVVRIIADSEENSVIATEKFTPALEKENGELLEDKDLLRENDEVDILVYDLVDLGAKVIVSDRFAGMIYANETFEPLKPGDHKKAYIKKIREDGKIDLSLQKQGFKEAVSNTRSIILKALDKNNGSLPLGDKSDPELIKDQLHMSKKMFKRTIGGLYKEGKLIISDTEIKLKDS